MVDARRSGRRLDQTVPGKKLGPQFSKKQKEKEIAEWAGVNATLLSARRNRGNYEVSAEDKGYLNTIAEARLKLEKR